MRAAARKDSVQLAVVQALRRIGVVVFVLNDEGLPDLLTYDRRARSGLDCWLPIEVKRSRGQLTAAQRATYRVAPFPIVETVDAALALFGVKA